MSDHDDIVGAEAFAAVMSQWKEGVKPLAKVRDAALARLSDALSDSAASNLDKAALLRQALRQESLRRGKSASIVLSSPPPDFDQVGLDIRQLSSGRIEISARSWLPSWLQHHGVAVDEAAMLAEERRHFSEEGPVADPALRSLGRTTYRSQAQQNAIRSALSMPSGALLVIDLPTGEGKSTVFQVIAGAGFASSPAGQVPGLVVVVVPTVTLALDHERNCDGSDDRPLAYVGGRDARNQLIRENILAGQQKILFAAPEAVVQSLRNPITRLARDGLLSAVVIDEAHLIDGWGTGFRTEFQTLAGILNFWREISSGSEVFRTVFLSATFSDGALETLEDLFSPGKPIPIVSGARIRPEPEYWIAPPAPRDQRARRVYEAICHLPRPAILYVTRVSDAESWSDNLRLRGFSRLGLVHGGTDGEERERVLLGWNDGAIDIVVATSAFGLGIDYAHVRTVIHACLPETLDRFYQEVGRGGRDGRASVSLLIPQDDDAQVAKSLSSKKVISIDRGFQRWRAMFEHPETQCEGYPRYAIALDVAPGYDMDDIDLRGERNTDWNQRTLALMARAGLIRLVGAKTDTSENESAPRQFERVDICEEGHLNRSTWQARVEPTRTAIATRGTHAFDLLRRFAAGNQCPARLIASLYGGESRHVALYCSGCQVCRDDPSAKAPEGLVPYRRPLWPIQASMAPILDTVWGPEKWAVVTYPHQSPARRVVRDLVDAVHRLDSYGIRSWIEVGRVAEWLRSSIAQTVQGKPWVVYSGERWAPVLWPMGARIIGCGPESVPTVRSITSDSMRSPRLIFVAEGSMDPDQPTRELASVLAGPVYRFEQFVTAILR
jgi:ATP-dependent DNA helicase RecQ